MSDKNDQKKWMNYFIPPPFITETYSYQNVNKDPNLRESITIFYYNKVIKWIEKSSEFKKYKSKVPFMKTKKGYIHVYKLLRSFVKRYDSNWYDLKKQYDNVKEYIHRKLAASTH